MCHSHVAALALSASLLSGGTALAEQVRYRFAPVDACGNTQLVRSGAGAVGEYQTWYAGPREPAYQQLRPTHVVTFRHPYTGRNVNVPMAFPDSTPRILYRSTSIVYSYATYTITALFQPDGTVEVVYNSGFFRSLPGGG